MLWVPSRNAVTDHRRATDALALNWVLKLATSLFHLHHGSDQLNCAWQHLRLTQTGGWYRRSVWPLIGKNRYFIVKWSWKRSDLLPFYLIFVRTYPITQSAPNFCYGFKLSAVVDFFHSSFPSVTEIIMNIISRWSNTMLFCTDRPSQYYPALTLPLTLTKTCFRGYRWSLVILSLLCTSQTPVSLLPWC